MQVIFEVGQIQKKLENFEEAQDMYEEGGKLLAEYFDHEIYGEFKGENHPLMQQYFLCEFEWASAVSHKEIEK